MTLIASNPTTISPKRRKRQDQLGDTQETHPIPNKNSHKSDDLDLLRQQNNDGSNNHQNALNIMEAESLSQ
jgi:hypothetical protein